MDYKLLNNLLDHYYSGTINPDDLEQLRKMLKTEHLPGEYQNHKQVILGIEQTSEFDLDSIDMTSELELLIEEQIAIDKQNSRIKWLKPLSFAASIAIIIALSVTYLKPTDTIYSAKYEDTYQSPEEAHKAALSVLQFIGHQINKGKKGIDKVAHLNKAFVPTNNALSKYQQNINRIQKILK